MENRFGLKDVITYALLLIIAVSVWLAMVQFDRQWERVQQIDSKLEEQSPRLVQLENRISDLEIALREVGKSDGESKVLLEAIAQVQTSLGQLAEGQIDNEALQAQLAALQERLTEVEAEAAAAVPADEDYFYRLHAARQMPDFAYGDWFIDAFNQTVGKLTPLVPADAYQQVIANYVLESLIVRDPETFEWRPWIAKSWTVSEDGLTITFDLREDVRFSDGVPLTAEDVVYTYELINNPDINAPSLRSYYENFESVEAEGDYRVVFRMKRPYFRSLDFSGGMQILPKHYYEQFTPEQFNELPGLLRGSGPYRLSVDPKTWQPGSGKIELVRNEFYWGPRPSFDKLIFREISDETAELTSFRNRELDRYGVTPDKYERLRKDEDLLDHADLYVYEAPNFGYRYLGWNQRHKGEPTPFADKKVRQAMTLLTNREEMAEQLMAGLATVATGPFHHLGVQANKDIEAWPYDLDRAVKLLKEAGWQDRDGDGVLENEEDEQFRFKLIYPAGSTNYGQMAFYLKDAYAQAGIVLEPTPTEWNTMLKRIQERDFEAITLGWTGSVEGDPKQIFHSDSMQGGGSNYVSYSNPKLDKLIDTARVTLDKEKRLAMWHEAHAILHADQPYTFLFFTKSPIFIDKRMRNVQITRSGMNARTEKYVPTALQLWTGSD